MFRFRAQPLISAAWFALGFIALRVVYRALFNGLNRGGQVLLDLPAFRLPEPVNHVVLLGPITSEGLAIAVASALPIALIILGFGVINAVLNVPALVARASHRGPLRSVAQALVIAWATLPSLTVSVRDVRRARALRGERGLAALLVPVMEQTLERAVALGTSMEVRGFAADPAPAAGPAEAVPAIHLDAVTLSYGTSWQLRGDVTLKAGQLAVLLGPTGSGKSTLLHAISGLHTHIYAGTLTGTLALAGVDRTLSPHRTAHLIGVISQQPRLAFVAESVREEIGFASRVQGAPRAEVERRVVSTAERVGITDLLDASTATLSAGQAHLVAIAAAIAHEPAVLLADEPLADLDADSRTRVTKLLRDLADQGLTVLVAEHRTADLLPQADVVLTLVPDGEDHLRVALSPGPHSPRQGLPPLTSPMSAPAPALAPSTKPSSPTDSPVAQIRGARVAFGVTTLIADATLTLGSEEIVAISGDVGSGKTSLLQVIALPRPGVVTIAGIDVAGLSRTKRGAALVPDLSDDLLFSITVERECARADHAAGAERGATAQRFATFLDLPELSTQQRAMHPRDLSVGQRRLLAIAIQLAPDPRLLLIDEPSRGLDQRAALAVREAIITTAKHGTPVLLATHDRAFAAIAHRRLHLANGQLHAEVLT